MDRVAEQRRTDFVQSLDRGLSVLHAVATTQSALTLSEVARLTGLSRATVRRSLHTFVELGYVKHSDGAFSLRPRVLELGNAYLSSLALPKVAQPHLAEVVAELHESCSISVLDDGEVVYVARAAAKRIMSVAISVGTRFPAYATSMGRVLLAAQEPAALAAYLDRTPLEPITERTVTDRTLLERQLDEVRRHGFAMVDQELEIGLRSLAVPVHGRDGGVIAALNVSAHAGRTTVDVMEGQFLPRLRVTAERIEKDLHRPA